MDGSDLSTMQDVRKLVMDSEGIITIKIGELKRIVGAGKLGVNVLKKISDSLHGEGLEHTPSELPQYQHNTVRLYLLNSKVANIITAVNVVGEEYDKVLREAAGRENVDVLQKVLDFVYNLKNN